MYFHSKRAELSNEVLTNSDEDPDHNEVGVVKHSFEDVDLIIDLSGGKHVEHLEEHKHVEYHGQMSGWGVVHQWSVNVLTIKALDHTIHDVYSVPPLLGSNWMCFDLPCGKANAGITWIRPFTASGFGCISVIRSLDSFRDELVSSKHEEKQNEGLEKRLTKNVLDHSLRDDVLVLSVGRSFQ